MNETHHRECSILMKANARGLRKKSTPQEQMLWRRLRSNRIGIKFRRQVVIDNKYVVDFVCLEKKLVVEVDGSQHAESTKDLERTTYLQQQGFEVLRFWNNEINKHLEACLEVIYKRCTEGYN